VMELTVWPTSLAAYFVMRAPFEGLRRPDNCAWADLITITRLYATIPAVTTCRVR
jgi:hypothetical protein